RSGAARGQGQGARLLSGRRALTPRASAAPATDRRTPNQHGVEMSQSSQHWVATAGQPLRGTLQIPGDKSVSHRAVMFAALADGTSTIDGFLEGEDTRATAAIFERLGVRIETPSASRRIVHGVGVDGLRAAEGPL